MIAAIPGGVTRNDSPQVTTSPYVIPEWLSPAKMIALSAPQVRSVVMPAGVEVQIAKPNALRVGLLVIVPSPNASSTFLAPVPNLGINGIVLAQQGNFFLASLSDWLSLVCGAWYGTCSGGTTAAVIDIVRT